MRKRIQIWPALMILLALFLAAPAAAQQSDNTSQPPSDVSPKKKKDKSDNESPKEKNREADKLFVLDKVWTVHLKLTPEAFKALEPAGGAGAFGPPRFDGQRPGGMGGPPTGMGLDFPEVKAAVEFEGQTLDDVGVRYKGNSTFMATRGQLKKSFKLDFNQFTKKQKLFGLTKLNLNCNALDPSQIREAISYEIFRQAGVPAPRTAFARVYLTVPGEHENKYLGLYTIVEQVDERFLQNHFASKDGLLLKPERIRGLPGYGDDWEKYAKAYDAKNDVPEDEAKRFITLTKLVNDASDEEFNARIRTFINVNAFMRFLALNGMMVNLDSILAMGQNYYIYHDTVEDQFHWIPWDLNMSFGGFPSGTTEQMINLSLAHPHAGKHALIDRLLAIPSVREAYLQQIKELTTTVFTVENVNAVIEKIKATARPAIADESKLALEQFDNALKETMPANLASNNDRPDGPTFGERGQRGFGDPMPGGPGSPGGRMGGAPLKPFIARRIEAVKNQLAGKSEGYTPANFGPGGGRGFGPPSGFGPADGFKADGSGETSAFPGPPPGMPGMLFAASLLRAADANSDGKLTQTEFKSAFGQWFKQWDADKNLTLDEAELGKGLDQLFRPPGFEAPVKSPGKPAAPAKKTMPPAAVRSRSKK